MHKSTRDHHISLCLACDVAQRHITREISLPLNKELTISNINIGNKFKNHNTRGRNFSIQTCFHPYKLCLKTYDNKYAKIQKLMMWLDGTTFHHMWVSRIFTCKSHVCCSCISCHPTHLTPPYIPCTMPPEKG
jgi:hypothetical protein